MSNQASDQLKQHARRIMQMWEERARDQVSASVHQSSLVLQDSLPQYLEQLSNELSTAIAKTPARIATDKAESTRIGTQHGHERAGYADYSSGGNKKARARTGGGKQRVSLAEDTFACCH